MGPCLGKPQQRPGQQPYGQYNGQGGGYGGQGYAPQNGYGAQQGTGGCRAACNFQLDGTLQACASDLPCLALMWRMGLCNS